MSDKKTPNNYIEKRRSVRIRRSKLLQETRDIEYKIAISTEEFEQAFELVTQQYINVGLHKKTSQLRLTRYHLLPDTKVFIAIRKNSDYSETVIGTITMITDRLMGLPMDELYKKQLNNLRSSGLNLAEVIGLSVSPEQSAIQNNIIVYLYKICLQYARLTHINDLLCSVSKKHIRFYEDLLLFKPVGEILPYSYANGQLAQGHRLDIHQASKEFKEVYSGMEFDADLHRFFFTETKKFSRPKGAGEAMTLEQMRYFFEKRSQLLSSLSNRDKLILRKEFKKINKKSIY